MTNTKGSKGHDRAALSSTGDPAHNQIIITPCPEAAALQQGITAHHKIVETVVDTSRTRLLAHAAKGKDCKACGKIGHFA